MFLGLHSFRRWLDPGPAKSTESVAREHSAKAPDHIIYLPGELQCLEIHINLKFC